MKTYYPSIDFFRGVAAFLVCLFHFTNYIDFRGTLFSQDSFIYNFGKLGVNGVYIFFVISGFVITLSLSKENFKVHQLHRFLLRRFIRIEIPYLASIVLIIMVGLLFAWKNHQPFIFDIERLLYNIVYLIPFSHHEWYNVIYWTLAIEFQFYILIGLLYFFLSSKNKVIIYLVLFLFGASGFLFTDNRFVFGYSTIFLQGIALFLIRSEKIDFKTGMTLIALSVCATAYLHSIEISIFSALTVIGIQYLEIDNRITKKSGEISYSLYLTHGLIGGNLLYLFSRYTTGFLEKTLLFIGALGASLFFSYIFWRLIEDPARRLSKKIKVA